MLYSTFETGKRIRRLRNSLNLSQEKFAECCNIYQSEVSKLENGKLGCIERDVFYCNIISDLFNVDLAYLLFGLLEKGDIYMKEQKYNGNSESISKETKIICDSLLKDKAFPAILANMKKLGCKMKFVSLSSIN